MAKFGHLSTLLLFLIHASFGREFFAAGARGDSYILAARPPRPVKGFMENLFFDAVEGMVQAVDDFPLELLDQTEFAAEALYDDLPLPARSYRRRLERPPVALKKISDRNSVEDDETDAPEEVVVFEKRSTASGGQEYIRRRRQAGVRMPTGTQRRYGGVLPARPETREEYGSFEATAAPVLKLERREDATESEEEEDDGNFVRPKRFVFPFVNPLKALTDPVGAFLEPFEFAGDVGRGFQEFVGNAGRGYDYDDRVVYGRGGRGGFGGGPRSPAFVGGGGGVGLEPAFIGGAEYNAVPAFYGEGGAGFAGDVPFTAEFR